jgi:hypothetical protein
VIQSIENFPTDTLVTNSEKLTFYINAYNIFAIKMIRDHWPIESITDAGNWFNPVWQKTVGRLNGKDITLHEIEHNILRPLGEPRIHFAIVCASLSCPDLRNGAYQLSRLDEQLDHQAKQFLRNSYKGSRQEGSTLRVSKIFDWFEEDFQQHGGVAAFVKKYLPQATFSDIAADLPYDWSLNGS